MMGFLGLGIGDGTGSGSGGVRHWLFNRCPESPATSINNENLEDSLTLLRRFRRWQFSAIICLGHNESLRAQPAIRGGSHSRLIKKSEGLSSGRIRNRIRDSRLLSQTTVQFSLAEEAHVWGAPSMGLIIVPGGSRKAYPSYVACHSYLHLCDG